MLNLRLLQRFRRFLGESGLSASRVRIHIVHFKNVIPFAGANGKLSVELAANFGLGGCPVGEGASG